MEDKQLDITKLSTTELKALCFDLFQAKQLADHNYQICVAHLRERENKEPTVVPQKKEDKK